MKLREGELKVFYRCDEGIDEKLDVALETTLRHFGYTRWASGAQLDEGGHPTTRDLAFEKKDKDEDSSRSA